MQRPVSSLHWPNDPEFRNRDRSNEDSWSTGVGVVLLLGVIHVLGTELSLSFIFGDVVFLLVQFCLCKQPWDS